jgi:hypothetical protein
MEGAKVKPISLSQFIDLNNTEQAQEWAYGHDCE